jgi:hypothetical protein
MVNHDDKNDQPFILDLADDTVISDPISPEAAERPVRPFPWLLGSSREAILISR